MPVVAQGEQRLLRRVVGVERHAHDGGGREAGHAPILAHAPPSGEATPVFGRTKEELPPQARLAGVAPEAPTGPSEAPLVALFALLTLAAIVFVLARAERAAERDPVARGARGETQALDRQSLLREPNLRRALTQVAASAHPLVTNIRVSATRVDLTVRDVDGLRRSISVDPAFKVDESDFGAGEDDAIPASKLDPSGPERMA